MPHCVPNGMREAEGSRIPTWTQKVSLEVVDGHLQLSRIK
jgi:hypothetical protein